MLEVNTALSSDWLVGSNHTVADLCAGFLMICLFQTLLDGGFRKAAPKATALFERVSKLESVVKIYCVIKPYAKALKPTIKVEEKKVAPKSIAVVKPKKTADDLEEVKKSEKNPQIFVSVSLLHASRRSSRSRF